MASLNELINLSQYQSGDMGRERLPVIHRATPQEQQAKQMQLKMLASKLNLMQQQEEIAKRKKAIWDGLGTKTNTNKTTPGVTGEIVDNPEAPANRDATVVGDYEPKVTPSGDLVISKKKDIKYDRIKVIDRAKKIVDSDLAMNGINKSTMKASDYSVRLKSAIPQAEQDLNMSGLAPAQAEAPQTKQPVNPTGLTSSPEDFLPQYQEKRGMIDVAKDFYFGGKKNSPAPSSQYQEGQTATNPKTGKRIVYKGGKWVALN